MGLITTAMPIWDDFVRDSLMQRRWIIAGIIVTIAVIAAAALVIAFPVRKAEKKKATAAAKKRESEAETVCPQIL